MPTLISLQEVIVPADDIELLTWVLVSVIRVMTIVIRVLLVPLPSSPLMEQFTRGYVVEQEGIRRDIQLLSGDIMGVLRQLLMVLMLIP